MALFLASWIGFGTRINVGYMYLVNPKGPREGAFCPLPPRHKRNERTIG
jgi:hypothetical protein